jgi:hypothetical protein
MKSFTVSQLMGIIIRINIYIYIHIHTYIYIFKMPEEKHLSEITPGVQATVERSARFHPTVGLATPSGFTTSHPRAETTML